MIKQNLEAAPSGGYSINMSPVNQDALRSLLAYFYTGKLDVPKYSTTAINGPETPSLAVLVSIYTLATEYQLPDLCIEVKRQFCATLASWPTGHGGLLAKALVASSADGLDELRELVLNVAVKFATELVEDKEVYALLEGEPLRALMLKMTRTQSRRDSAAREGTKKRSTDAALKRLEGGSVQPTSSFGRYRTSRSSNEYGDNPHSDLLSDASTPSDYKRSPYSPVEAPITGSVYAPTYSTASTAAWTLGYESPGSEQNSQSGNDTPPAPTVASFRF